MKALFDSFKDSSEYKLILDSLITGEKIDITGPVDSARVHICACLLNDSQRKGIYIAHNELRARRFYEDFEAYFGENAVFLPPRDVLLYNTEARSNETLYSRLAALKKIYEGNYKILVTSCEAVVQKLMEPERLFGPVVTLSVGDSYDIAELSSRLLMLGYERTTEVDGKGQFCVRGGIVDIFVPTAEDAVRLDFFGDEVDSVRTFDVITQRSVENIQSIDISPAAEIIFNNEDKSRFLDLIKQDLNSFTKNNKAMNREELQELETNVMSDLEKFEASHYFQGEEKYLSYILKDPCSLLDYCNNHSVIFIDEAPRFIQRMENIEFEIAEMCKNLAEKKLVLPSVSDINFSSGFIHNRILKNVAVIMNSVSSAS